MYTSSMKVVYAFVSSDGVHSNHLDRLFGIDRDTGLIRLLPEVIAADDLTDDYYNVTVVATDDGQCCGGGGATYVVVLSRRSRAADTRATRRW